MYDRREQNVEIFQHTIKSINENKELKEAQKASQMEQKIILEKDVIPFSSEKKHEQTKIVVSKKRSLDAAGAYAKQGKKVMVLNFASSTNPGGGVKRGSSAQEEALCRCSSLYPCLNTNDAWKGFYEPHRMANNPLYNADCIYTPGIIVFKSNDDFPKMLSKEDWFKVDVLSCAAPNLRKRPGNVMNPRVGNKPLKISERELLELLERRIDRIFSIAKANQEEVLILGAFGCGAFCNPPRIVAKAFFYVQKKYENCFDTIEYAIYCRDFEDDNYKEFCKTMRTLTK